MWVAVDNSRLSGSVFHLVLEVSAGHIRVPMIDLNICPLHICAAATAMTCIWAKTHRYIGDVLMFKHIHDILRRGAHANTVDGHM